MAWRDPWETVDRANALRGQQDAQTMGMLAQLGNMQTNALQMQQMRQGMADEQATRQAYTEAAGDPTKLRDALSRLGLYKQVQAQDKADLDRKTAEAKISRDRADAFKNIHGVSKEQFGIVMQNPTPESAVSALQRVSDTMKGFGFSGDVTGEIQKVSQMNPEQIKQWAAAQALSADKLLPTFQTRNTGGTTDTIKINPITGGVDVVNSVANTASPDAVMSDARIRSEGAANRSVTMRGQDKIDARAREANMLGRVPSGYRLAPDGVSLEAIPGGPADGKADKLGERAKGQITGIDSLFAAIDDYVGKMGEWSRLKNLSPSQRAQIGTTYNNMMLQAKEAYNLGVLNGPDYQILQSVIADPTNPKNLLLSPEAMAGQANELKRLMERTRAAVKNQGRGDSSPALQGSPRVPRVASDADYNALPSGATFIDPEGKTRRKP